MVTLEELNKLHSMLCSPDKEMMMLGVVMTEAYIEQWVKEGGMAPHEYYPHWFSDSGRQCKCLYYIADMAYELGKQHARNFKQQNDGDNVRREETESTGNAAIS